MISYAGSCDTIPLISVRFQVPLFFPDVPFVCSLALARIIMPHAANEFTFSIVLPFSSQFPISSNKHDLRGSRTEENGYEPPQTRGSETKHLLTLLAFSGGS